MFIYKVILAPNCYLQSHVKGWRKNTRLACRESLQQNILWYHVLMGCYADVSENQNYKYWCQATV